MPEKLFCTINQQPCGTDGQGDGLGSCGSCKMSEKFLWDIYDMLRPSGATGFWKRDEGDTLTAGYISGRRKAVLMRIRRGDTVG